MEGAYQEITLSPMEFQYAAAIASARVAPKTTGGNLHGKKDCYEAHLEGAVGELCFTKVHGGEVSQAVYHGGDHHSPDIILPDGRAVEVKTSTFTGRDVTIKFTPGTISFEWCSLVQLLGLLRARVFPVWKWEEIRSNATVENYGYGDRIVYGPMRHDC